MTSAVKTTEETTTDTSAPAWVGRDGSHKGSSRLGGGIRRRRLPYLLVGVLLVVICAGGGILAATQLGDRQSVLALTHPVAVGHTLTSQDLAEVSVATDSGMDLVPASATSALLGQSLAYSLPAGSLITRSVLGEPQVPARGRAIAALALKPGQFPPDLSPGTTVLVLTADTPGAAPDAADARASSWTAVVTGLAARETEQTTVVSLELPEADARAVASAPSGQLTLVMVAGGGR